MDQTELSDSGYKTRRSKNKKRRFHSSNNSANANQQATEGSNAGTSVLIDNTSANNKPKKSKPIVGKNLNCVLKAAPKKEIQEKTVFCINNISLGTTDQEIHDWLV